MTRKEGRAKPPDQFDWMFVRAYLRVVGYAPVDVERIAQFMHQHAPPRPQQRFEVHDGANRKARGRPRKPPVLTVVKEGAQ